MLDITMSKIPAKDEGMCFAYAMESIFKFYKRSISIDQIWGACKEKRPGATTPFFMTTLSSVNYFNQMGIASTAVIVKSISSSLDILASQNRTCISIMRWKGTTLGHAYVFLGVNSRRQYCFLDSDRPKVERALSAFELHNMASRCSNEVIGNELILVSDKLLTTMTCGQCKKSIIILEHFLTNQIERFLCTSCNAYNLV